MAKPRVIGVLAEPASKRWWQLRRVYLVLGLIVGSQLQIPHSAADGAPPAPCPTHASTPDHAHLPTVIATGH